MLEQKKQLRATNILLLMLFVYPIINDYVRYIVNAVIPISQDTFDTIVWICALFPCVTLFRKVRVQTFAFWGISSIIALISFCLTDYAKFDGILLFRLVFTIIIAIFIGEKIQPEEKTKDVLYYASVISLFIALFYSSYRILTGKGIGTDNMGFAYEILPAVLIVIARVFDGEKKAVPVVFMTGAVILLLVQGTRGPILCVIVFTMLMLVKKYGFAKFVIYALVGLIVLSALIVSDSFIDVLVGLVEKIGNVGFSPRVLYMLLNGEISFDNGRDVIEERLMGEIKANPFRIRGLYADYEWTRGLSVTASYSFPDGVYAHNIFLELIFDFGVLIGGILCVVLVIALLRILIKCSRENSYIVCLFICTGFVNLLMSGSYLNSKLFFVLIGLMFNKEIYRKISR